MYNTFAPPQLFPFVWPLMMVIVLVDLVLRGMALWKSARSGRMYWFIALLVINSMGILPLIYILFFQDKPLVRTQSVAASAPRPKKKSSRR